MNLFVIPSWDKFRKTRLMRFLTTLDSASVSRNSYIPFSSPTRRTDDYRSQEDSPLQRGIFNTARGFHIRTKAGIITPVFRMGKVRIEMVKRISRELVNRYDRSLTTDFEQNKQFLNEIGLDVSKKLRNKIAGYVTGLMKIEATAEF